MGVMTISVNPFFSLWVLLRYTHLEFKCLIIPCFMPTCTLEREGHFLLPFSFILQTPPRSDKGPSGKLSYNEPLINIGPVPRSHAPRSCRNKQERRNFCLEKSQLFIFLILSEGWKSMRFLNKKDCDAHFALILQEVIYHEEMHNRHPLPSCVLQ